MRNEANPRCPGLDPHQRHSPRPDFIGLTVRLFGSFCSLTLAETNPGAAAVLVDEFDAGHFIAASSWAVIRCPLTSPLKRPVVPLTVAALGVLVALLKGRSIGEGALTSLAILSPSVMMGIERGNIDLFILALVGGAALIAAEHRPIRMA